MDRTGLAHAMDNTITSIAGDFFSLSTTPYRDCQHPALIIEMLNASN
jgi:hypothetical protein